MSKKQNRRPRGSILAEGAVGLIILTSMFVASMLMLLCVSAIVYYKIKLTLATTQIAAYASSLELPSNLTWAHNQQPGANFSTVTAQTTQYATTVLTAAGLNGPSTAPQINVTYGPLAADSLAVTVSIKLTSLPLFGNGTVLPNFMDFQESAFGVARYDQPPGLNSYHVPGTAPTPWTTVYAPGYGWAPGGATGDSPRDVMKLRTGYLSTSPTIIPFGIPSAGSGTAGAGNGSIGEDYDAGAGVMTDLPGGITNF